MMKTAAVISFDDKVTIGVLESTCLSIAHSGHAHDCEVTIEDGKLVFKYPQEDAK